MSAHNVGENTASKRRPWVLVAAWFSTIALVGVLKRILDHQRPV